MIVVQAIEGKVDQNARRAAADKIVRDKFGCGVIRNADGAPSTENGKAHISISHTDRFIAVAFAYDPVGVDIELRTRQVDHLASRFATLDEIAICREVFPENPALLIWCTKEATYKTLHRQGVDFIKDMTITSATTAQLAASVNGDNRMIELKWELCDNLLTVCTI